MDEDAQARAVIQELDKPITYAVNKIYRRYGGRIDKDELHSQALEAALVFAGLIPEKHANAGKLTEWRDTLSPKDYARRVQHSLDMWLSRYAGHELDKRKSRPAEVSYNAEPGRGPNLQSQEESGYRIPYRLDNAALADPESESGFRAVDLALFMAATPILYMHHILGMSLAAIAAILKVREATVFAREQKEKERFRERWAA